MHAVKALGLFPGHADAPGCDNAQPCFFKLGGDLAGQIAAGGIGFDDRKSAFGRHGGTRSIIRLDCKLRVSSRVRRQRQSPPFSSWSFEPTAPLVLLPIALLLAQPPPFSARTGDARLVDRE